MAIRKPENFEERRIQIIAGALEVFSQYGFEQATNKQIAAAAGIQSPGLIYHYFKDKADLLRAVAQYYAPPLQLIAQGEQFMALAPQDALTQLGHAYLRLMDNPQIGAFFRLALGQALRDPHFARLMGDIAPLRFWRFLAEYLKKQMDNGTLRPSDSHIAAQCFLGPLLMQVLLRDVLRVEPTELATSEHLVAAHVEGFLHGRMPDP